MTEEKSYAQNSATSPTSGFNSMRFAIEQAQNAKMTCTIVKVKKITGGKGDVAAIGRVEVIPLVQMIDGIGRTVDHVSVYNLPYLRMVGGKNAVIIDPKADDIGIVVIADRDISGVKQSKKASPPGSKRTNNLSDGIYLGSVIAEAPESYIRFKEDGTIIAGVGKNNPCECVIASDHVQMKKKGNSALHVTVDAASGQLVAGMAFVVGPDPFPDD
jgi:hypothetical protein